jgi:hypothetical protein
MNVYKYMYNTYMHEDMYLYISIYIHIVILDLTIDVF